MENYKKQVEMYKKQKVNAEVAVGPTKSILNISTPLDNLWCPTSWANVFIKTVTWGISAVSHTVKNNSNHDGQCVTVFVLFTFFVLQLASRQSHRWNGGEDEGKFLFSLIGFSWIGSKRLGVDNTIHICHLGLTFASNCKFTDVHTGNWINFKV